MLAPAAGEGFPRLCEKLAEAEAQVAASWLSWLRSPPFRAFTDEQFEEVRYGFHF